MAYGQASSFAPKLRRYDTIIPSIQDGLTPEKITAKAKEIELKLDQPHLKQFLEQYTENKATDTE
ncbi:hypothetical protein WA1_33865 [Scytonema hofmannii PCC 7110]|uniref:Uncharacterized protein n=1 Tax=Scytonema hofmannii PCC 7110 TaxID=128403 RepID=A0A139X2V1_9CYAN|nr:hypothetical protein [Scytonema hofmannii]KYC38983.1 hypothetical protein WA1_33865 [Scytonema hofmannii PCC 7110]